MDAKTSNISSLRIPLWFILVVPSVSIIISISTLINFLSYRNSQQAINTIAEELLDEITARIEFHLTDILSVPMTINKIHAHVIRSGLLDITDIPAFKQYLWETIQVFDTVSSTYIGSPTGGLINSGREGLDGSLYLMFTEDFSDGELSKYATDIDGNETQLLSTVQSFDSRTRPWYIGAIENQGAFRTEPYVLSTGQDLAIASSLPIYAEDGELLGVASVDIFLSQISDYLGTLEIGETGEVYIVDSNGMLIASSVASPLIMPDEGLTWRQIPANESENQVIATTSLFIDSALNGIENATTATDISLMIADEPYYLWVTPYQNSMDFDWYVITAIPETDFLAEIQTHNRNTLYLIVVLSLVATGIGAFFAIRVTRSITKLSTNATNYAKGDWSQVVKPSQIIEIDRVGVALSSMAKELHEAMSTLEQRVERRTAELAESESRYRAIVEDQTDLICRFLPDTTLTFVNQAYCAFVQQAPESLIGTSFLQFIPEEDHPNMRLHISELGGDNTIAINEHRMITPVGDYHWVQWVNRVLYDKQGNFLEFQSVGRDITKHKQLEDNLKRSLQHELELNELKTHFISTVSHEFRTPMALILNSSQFLQNYSNRINAEKKEFHLNRINEQIDRMVEILEGVLMINRAEQGKLKITQTHFDLEQLCQITINEVRTVTPRKINFNLKTTGACTNVYGDRKLIRLIVTNLVSNATKYSNDDGHVWITIDCNDRRVKIIIKDDGIGMTKEVQAHIFDPFYRADQSGSVEGIGLGLSIVKQCVELHKGSISLVSVRGIGTEFTVEFPQ